MPEAYFTPYDRTQALIDVLRKRKSPVSMPSGAQAVPPPARPDPDYYGCRRLWQRST